MIQEDINSILDVIDFNKLQNKSILITGSSGLLGIYLVNCLKLLQKEYNITVYVWSKDKIESYFEEFFNFDCHIINRDITDNSNFIGLPKFDFIIHSSGYGQPNKFLEDRIKTIQINTEVTINLFKILNPTGTFLFLSSSEVYNGLNKALVSETDIGTTNTNDTRSCYIESKRCGESICHIYRDMGIDVKIIRLSLTYGPGTKRYDNRVVNSLIQKSIFNCCIELKDSGDAIRTYCYISDAIEMIWNIFLHGKSVVYNVGGIETCSIYDLALKLSKFTKKSILSPIDSKPLIGSPILVKLDISKYLNEFIKFNFVDLDTGLKETIQWQKEIYGK